MKNKKEGLLLIAQVVMVKLLLPILLIKKNLQLERENVSSAVRYLRLVRCKTKIGCIRQ